MAPASTDILARDRKTAAAETVETDMVVVRSLAKGRKLLETREVRCKRQTLPEEPELVVVGTVQRGQWDKMTVPVEVHQDEEATVVDHRGRDMEQMAYC